MKKSIYTFLIVALICSLAAVFLTACNNEASNSPEPTQSEIPQTTTEPTVTTEPIQTLQPSIIPVETPEPSPTPVPGINPAEDAVSLSILEEYIERYFARFDGRYGITFIDIESGASFGLNEIDKFIAASTSKLPINLYLFKLIEEGIVDPEMEMEYIEDDREWGTGKIIKGEYGDVYTVSQLIEYSLTLSDNCAINMIIRLCELDNILAYMKDLGAIINYGDRHRTCPADMAVFTRELYDKYKENPELYGIMINYLDNTLWSDRIDKYLPKDLVIPHKIGNYLSQNAYNDVGIVYADRPYIVSIMSEQTNENLEAIDVLADVSLIIYNFMEDKPYENVMNPIVEARPEAFGFEYDVINDSEAEFYKLIDFGSPDEYASADGVLTFRGNNYRNGGAYGSVDVSEEELEVIWSFDVGVIDNWPGTGWTGQPSIINWPVETVNLMNVYPEFKDKELKEVIYAAMDGFIYFCELETGTWTRPPIEIGFPTKGSVTVDPRGYPILYTGQGVDYNGDTYGMPKYRMFSLIDQTLIYEIPGYDANAYRGWYAFDSSGLLYAPQDIYIECAENGLIYIMKLNTVFNKETGEISVNPETVKYRYKNPINGRLGIENSPVVYGRYMFFADNGGLLQCIDLNKLEPVWMFDMGDDTDGSVVLEETDKGIFIYASNELDLRGKARQAEIDEMEEDEKPDEIIMDTQVRKFNALTGELIWEVNYPCYYDSYINGGSLATTLVGTNDIDDRIIVNIAKTGSVLGGCLAALRKDTGEEIWAYDMTNYSWSTPTAISSSNGKTYILYCNFSGRMLMIDPINGMIVSDVNLGANIESTPAVYNDIAVVGSYAKKIWGIRIN
ncbi:MAG: serine hydrolase [Clostridiales bacterium]|nr:serine hydrolase [Clostridiales bacterium]